MITSILLFCVVLNLPPLFSYEDMYDFILNPSSKSRIIFPSQDFNNIWNYQKLLNVCKSLSLISYYLYVPGIMPWYLWQPLFSSQHCACGLGFLRFELPTTAKKRGIFLFCFCFCLYQLAQMWDRGGKKWGGGVISQTSKRKADSLPPFIPDVWLMHEISHVSLNWIWAGLSKWLWYSLRLSPRNW